MANLLHLCHSGLFVVIESSKSFAITGLDHEKPCKICWEFGLDLEGNRKLEKSFKQENDMIAGLEKAFWLQGEKETTEDGK